MMRLYERVSLAPLTTLGVGGAARFFVEARTKGEVEEALQFAREKKLALFVLGGGSNIVIADAGFDGLVLAIRIGGITEEMQEDTVLLTVGAGVVWDELVAYTTERGYIGMECLSGVPGTVGGAVVANLGAYGAQCSDVFASSDVLVREDTEDRMRVFERDECDFAYHDSFFAREPGRHIVLNATFRLATKGTSHLSYRDNRFDLQALATAQGREPTPGDVRTTILQMRKEKGMVVGVYKSAGSFFHMPFVSAQKHAEIASLARSLDAAKEERLRPWAWREADGSYKIAGGFLLEYTPFTKGYVQNGAGISPKHMLSIINAADARACDIDALASAMQDAVRRIFDVRLVREVEYVGDVAYTK